MRWKWILVGGFLFLAIIVGITIGLKRERSLAVEAATMHLAKMASPVFSGEEQNKVTYTIKDVDNYGRNWTIWALDSKKNAIAVNVHSSRGVGPVPLFNTSGSLIITDVETPVLME